MIICNFNIVIHDGFIKNEYIIDFDSRYTQISADATSSYFDIYMNGLEPERYYKILIQVNSEERKTVNNNNYYFCGGINDPTIYAFGRFTLTVSKTDYSWVRFPSRWPGCL